MIKTIAAAVFLALCLSAIAGWRSDLTGDRWAERPVKILVDGAWKDNPTAADYAAAQIREDTAQELADEAAAAAIAQSNAQAQASLPQVFTNGIATIDAEGHHIKHVAIGEAIVPIPISQSPLDPETAARLEAEGVAKWKEKQAAQKEAQIAKESAMQEAVAITAEVAKKEATAKLEATAAAAGGKELTDKQEHDIMWKYFSAEQR